MLESVNLSVVKPDGAYFALANAENVDPDRYLTEDKNKIAADWQFCSW